MSPHGQKGFNGVALLSKLPFDEVTPRPAGDPDDEQARFIEGVFSTVRACCARLSLSAQRQPGRQREISLQAGLDEHGCRSGRRRLLGAGGAAGAGRRLQRHSRADRRSAPRTGSTTRCSSRRRGAPSARWSISASPTPIRAVTDAPHRYTFWDYQAGAWQKNNGIRIDHLLLSPQAADRLVKGEIDWAPRLGEAVRPRAGVA